MFNPYTKEKKLSPTTCVVEELELFHYPSVLVMKAELHIEIDTANDWYVDYITIDSRTSSERLQLGSWLDVQIRITVNNDPKLQDFILQECGG